MGGRDKPLEEFAGRPLIAHVVARLAPQVAHVAISCNRNTERYAQWADAVVVDDVAGEGPLRGILAALERIDTPFAFICPGDAPRLSTSLVADLARAWSDGDTDVCVPHDGERIQPLFLLLHASVRAALRAYLGSGGRSVHGWIATLRAQIVPIPDANDTFTNVNTPADIAALTERGE